jgi:Tfp pilus assembly protein PilF
MKKGLTSFLMLILATGLWAKVMVFPFQVDSLKKMNHQWLGMAISYYLARGLELNAIEAVSDSTIHSTLNTYNIKFPFQISKAGCIKLAVLAGAKQMVWGEVTASEDPQTHNVQIQTTILEPETYSQRYLPLIKFHLKDFHKVKRELLNLILNYFKIESAVYPELNLDHHHYETFIKSFLISDLQKRIPVLVKLSEEQPASDFLNIEIAKVYSVLGQSGLSQQYLKKISARNQFRPAIQFLEAMHLMEIRQTDPATKILQQLKKENYYSAETLNNLGVITAEKKLYSQAADHFHQSLQVKKDPRVYANYVQCLIARDDKDLALENLKIALFYFPDDEKLITLFSFFLSREKESESLLNVFSQFIPNLTAVPEAPDSPFQLKNPFELQTYDNLYYLIDFDQIVKTYKTGDTASTIKKIGNLMEMNPFIPGLHRFLAEIYEKQGNPSQSRLYLRSAAFLKRRS